MDRESKAAVWSNVKDSDVVRTILQQNNYNRLDIEDTPATHGEDKHTLVQSESDLRFVQRLARRNGCLFWISCDEKGNETAHFRRPKLDGKPAGDLLINLNAASLNTLDITWDVERPTSTIALQPDLNTKSVIDGSAAQSPLTSLGRHSFSSIATGPRSLRLVTPVDDAGDLGARSEAALIEASFFVRATCQTSLTAAKSLLRSHTLVSLRGAGSRHSGTYFCAGVRHVIDNTAHRMEVDLIRNGWGA
jgi:phage protein D